MEIEYASQWNTNAVIDLTIKVTYSGIADSDSVKPITFHNETFRTGKVLREGICLYRLREDGRWERCKPDDGFGPGFGIFYNPPIAVNIGDLSDKNSDRFTTLNLRESWTTQRRVQNGTSWTSLPDDVEMGDRFKYVVKGAIVNWWDWGTTEEHRNTVVQLPCWISGDVVEPGDNGGRPKIVVPASNEVEFEYAG
jgi:hypothetical protein